jgi:hypothetical protein
MAASRAGRFDSGLGLSRSHAGTRVAAGAAPVFVRRGSALPAVLRAPVHPWAMRVRLRGGAPQGTNPHLG